MTFGTARMFGLRTPLIIGSSALTAAFQKIKYNLLRRWPNLNLVFSAVSVMRTLPCYRPGSGHARVCAFASDWPAPGRGTESGAVVCLRSADCWRSCFLETVTGSTAGMAAIYPALQRSQYRSRPVFAGICVSQNTVEAD